jgi:hypothetical protein
LETISVASKGYWLLCGKNFRVFNTAYHSVETFGKCLKKSRDPVEAFLAMSPDVALQRQKKICKNMQLANGKQGDSLSLSTSVTK